MFTGIVHSTGKVIANTGSDKDRQLVIKTVPEFLKDLEIGASIAVDGVCLTVTEFDTDTISFDVIITTLAHTTFKGVLEGRAVNLERSLTKSSEYGGHDVSGHVDTTATIIDINDASANYCLTFQIAPEKIPYIFSKGFIAINGVSLTVGSVDKEKSTFDVWLIPETLRRTNLGVLENGMPVNIELHKGTQVLVDTITDVVGKFLQSALKEGQLDGALLSELSASDLLSTTK